MMKHICQLNKQIENYNVQGFMEISLNYRHGDDMENDAPDYPVIDDISFQDLDKVQINGMGWTQKLIKITEQKVKKGRSILFRILFTIVLQLENIFYIINDYI